MAYNYVPRLSSTGLLTLPYYNGPPNPFKPLRVRYYEVDANGTTHHGECTTYAYGRWLEIARGDNSKLAGLFEKYPSVIPTRNGGAWVASSPSLYVGKTNPQPGDILCLKQGSQQNYWGHVAVVEEVHFDYIVTSESEHSDDLFDIVTRMKSLHYLGQSQSGYYVSHGYTLQGFLRMRDVPSPPTQPDFDMPTEWVNGIDHFIAEGSDEEYNNVVMAWVALKSTADNWTLEAIAGVLGNMWAESTLNPGMREINAPQNGGLVGWTPLTKWSVEAARRGIPWNDGDGQCQWVSSGNYWAPNPSTGVMTLYTDHWVKARMDTPMTYTEYRQCTDTPEMCAKHFMQGYEGPQYPAASIALRQRKAREYYDFLLGLDFQGSSRPYKHKMPVWMMAQKPYTKLIY